MSAVSYQLYQIRSRPKANVKYVLLHQFPYDCSNCNNNDIFTKIHGIQLQWKLKVKYYQHNVDWPLKKLVDCETVQKYMEARRFGGIANLARDECWPKIGARAGGSDSQHSRIRRIVVGTGAPTPMLLSMTYV